MNSTEKVVALMKILGHEPYVYGVTELGEMIGCGKSGTFKLLSVLVKEGLAAQTADHKYTLGIMTYLLGKRYEENVGVVRAVRPYMQKLRDLTGEAVTFGMLVNGTPTSICREEGTSLVRVMSHVGNSRPRVRGRHRHDFGGLHGPRRRPPDADGGPTQALHLPYHHRPLQGAGGAGQHPQAGLCRAGRRL